jgi:glyoxylase-like metal-dependent hydrolase (beta-lactamase superfamily II)
MLVVRNTVVGPFAENTLLVGDGETGEAILIDPGGSGGPGGTGAPGDPGSDLERTLLMREPGPFHIARIFLTHGHIDHVAGCAEAKGRLGVPCQIHRGDAPWLDAIPQQAEMFGFKCARERPDIDHFHEDGETLTMGEHEGRIVHTPGHSRGSCCLFFEKARILFAGDTLFAGSVGRTDLPGGDFEALERSIREKLFPLGDDVRFFPGHGPSAMLGDERLRNPFVGEVGRRGRFV